MQCISAHTPLFPHSHSIVLVSHEFKMHSNSTVLLYNWIVEHFTYCISPSARDSLKGRPTSREEETFSWFLFSIQKRRAILLAVEVSFQTCSFWVRRAKRKKEWGKGHWERVFLLAEDASCTSSFELVWSLRSLRLSAWWWRMLRHLPHFLHKPACYCTISLSS